MSIHLVIIDAMNLIRRVHAVLTQPEDIETTSKNCCHVLRKIIHHSSPTHLIAVFDNMEADRGWRAQLLPEYKQGREPMPTPLKNGLEKIQDAFFDLGADSLLSKGDEADDMIATLASKVALQGAEVTIVSTDKGYCQLLQPTLRIRDYFHQRWLDLSFVKTHFNIETSQLADYWGLVGMASRGVTGVPGIGPKSATLLLNAYPSLEALFSDKNIEPKWHKKLEGHEEQAFKCREIARLKTDIPLGFNLQDIRYTRNA